MKSNFVNIQLDWVTKWGMSPAEAMVYGYLHGWLVDQKQMQFSQTQGEIAATLGMSRRSLIRIAARLEQLGCITAKRTTTGITYTCNAVTKWHKPDMLYNSESDKVAHGDKMSHCDKVSQSMCQDGTKGCDNVAQDTLYNTLNNTHNTSDDARAREKELAAGGVVESVGKLVEEMQGELIGNAEWAMSAMRLYGLTTRQLSDAVAMFADKLAVDGVSYKSRSDFRRHFNNWLRIQVNQNQRNGNNGQQTLPGTNISAEYLARQLAVLGE